MGYTHYWRRDRVLDHAKFLLSVQAIKKLSKAKPGLIVHEYDKPNQPPTFTPTRIWFNGIGKDGHETFVIDRVFKPEEWEKGKRGKRFAFCKTAQKPYDILVTGALIVLKYHLGEAITVSSDGDLDIEWVEPIKFVNDILGEEYTKDFRV
jgi:hypothetical protein